MEKYCSMRGAMHSMHDAAFVAKQYIGGAVSPLPLTMSMFRTMQNVRGAVSLFYDSSNASKALISYIKKTFPDEAKRSFDIDLKDGQPTKSQLESIAEFSPEFKKITVAPLPLLVDWFHGKVAENETAAKHILDELKKLDDKENKDKKE